MGDHEVRVFAHHWLRGLAEAVRVTLEAVRVLLEAVRVIIEVVYYYW